MELLVLRAEFCISIRESYLTVRTEGRVVASSILSHDTGDPKRGCADRKELHVGDTNEREDTLTTDAQQWLSRKI